MPIFGVWFGRRGKAAAFNNGNTSTEGSLTWLDSIFGDNKKIAQAKDGSHRLPANGLFEMGAITIDLGIDRRIKRVKDKTEKNG